MPAREITNLGSPFRVSIDRLDARQYYVVDGLFDADDVSEAIVQGLPQPTTTITIGSSDSMVVRALSRKRVLTTVPQGAQGHVAIWEVESSRFFSGSLGYRKTTELKNEGDLRIKIPNYKKIPAVATGTNTYDLWIPLDLKKDDYIATYPRGLTTAVRTIQTSGISSAAVLNYNALHKNQYRTIDGIPFLYDYTDMTTTPDNQQTLRVVYHTVGPVPAFAVRFWGYEHDLAVPALGYLDEYRVNGPSGTPAGTVPPSIEKKLFTAFFSPLDPFPSWDP